VEENDTFVDVVILVCLLLTLLFDIVLIAIILAHEDLRKKRVNLFMISICTSDAFFAIYLIVFLQPGINEGRYADFVNATFLTCKWSNVVAAYLMTASWYNFLVRLFSGLNLERLYAIKRPFDFKNNSWSRVIVFCWVLAILPAIPLIFNTTIEKNWENKTDCKCFYPIDDKIWMFWTLVTNFLIPTALIFLIWAIMAHHFLRNRAIDIRSRILKRMTVKMVFITGLFLVTIWPYCITFFSAALSTPNTTKWLDWTFLLTLLNGMIQPLIFISFFASLREVLVKVKRGECKRTAMSLAIFKTTQLWHNFEK